MQELEEYIKGLLDKETEPFNARIYKSWAYGAVDFALKAGLVDIENAYRLFKKYGLVGVAGTRLEGLEQK